MLPALLEVLLSDYQGVNPMIKKGLFLICFLILSTTSTAFAEIHVGDKVPVFKGQDMNGKDFDLSTIVGKKPIMLVFWTTWCRDCQPKLNDINAMAEKFGKDDVAFVGINVGMDDTVEQANIYIKENKMTYPNMFDNTGELSEKYQLNKVFALILVSKDGTILMRLNNVPKFDESVVEMLNSYKRPLAKK